MNTIPDSFEFLGYDGVFGLAISSNSILTTLQKNGQIMARKFCLQMADRSNSKLQIGGCDVKPLVTVPLSNLGNLWQFKIDFVEFESEKIMKNCEAVLDSSIYYIGVPKNIFDVLINKIGGRKRVSSYYLYEVECAKKNSLNLNVAFNIRGKQFKLSPKDYISEVNYSD